MSIHAAEEAAINTVIILPTYNERGNIAALIEAIDAVACQRNHGLQMLVVDDRSPDGTAEVVSSLRAKYANLHLLVGRKRGLGAAYIRGIRHAIEHLGAEVVMQMDADFSHDPEAIPRLLAELENGADFVIGSRYVKGGRIVDWDRSRRLLSRLGNRVARTATGLFDVRDCTSGYRAIRVALLRDMPLQRLRVQGYAFQSALLLLAKMQGGRIREVPIDFVERVRGESKLALGDMLEFALNIGWMRPGLLIDRYRHPELYARSSSPSGAQAKEVVDSPFCGVRSS